MKTFLDDVMINTKIRKNKYIQSGNLSVFKVLRIFMLSFTENVLQNK